MDDAGGGRRGLRAEVSSELLKALHREYGMVSTGRDLGGSSNLNLLVHQEHEPDGILCVARVYRPYVTAARLTDIQRVRRELIAGGVPCGQPIKTRTEQTWIEVGQRITSHSRRLVEVEPYVACDAVMDSWERLEIGLPVLGRIHALLRPVQVSVEGAHPPFANYLAAEDTLTSTRRGISRIRAWGASFEEENLAFAAEQLARRIVGYAGESWHLLPRQLVHGDFWGNNVFFREDRVMFVADFDFMGERARIDDLALTLYFATLSHLIDQSAVDQQRHLRRLVELYEQGLGERLTRHERTALPVALARQPLWSIGGWIAHLDDERSARQHASGMYPPIEWASQIMGDLDSWQEALS
jgi:homoserine kinase type II